MATTFRHRLITAAAALACTLAAGPIFAIEQGAFEAGLYTAPGQLFTVKSPLGPSPILVDSFDEQTGAVTFLDDTGELYGLICTPNYDVLAGADNDFETDAAILRNWFRDATFPLFFARQLPGATIIHEEPGTFDGAPAWFAVMHLPRGSAMFRNDAETGLPTRLDSIRGVVVFSRGGQTYLIMTETAPEPEWKAFLPKLADFYRGIAFSNPDGLMVLDTFADLSDVKP